MDNETIEQIGTAMIFASCFGMVLVFIWVAGARPSSVFFKKAGNRIFKRALLFLALGFFVGSMVLLLGPMFTRAH